MKKWTLSVDCPLRPEKSSARNSAILSIIYTLRVTCKTCQGSGRHKTVIFEQDTLCLETKTIYNMRTNNKR